MFRATLLLSVLAVASFAGEPVKPAKPAPEPALPAKEEIEALTSKDEARALAKQVCENPETWTQTGLEARRAVLLAISKRTGPGIEVYVRNAAGNDVAVGWSSSKGTVSHLDLLWVSSAPTKEELLTRFKALKLALQVQQDHNRVLSRFVAYNADKFGNTASKTALYDWLDAQRSGLDTKAARLKINELK